MSAARMKRIFSGGVSMKELPRRRVPLALRGTASE
jgi:hypothetical protein